jgi:Na+-transporting NADH:ubiquinone oxidoreductase subunit F
MTEIVIASAVLVGLILGLTVALLLARGRLVPQCSLQVLVNDTKALAAQRGDSLLEVLHRNNVLIPAACGGSGTCGLCRVVVTGSGVGEPQATERGILSPKERRSHVRLACQTKLRGSCSATVLADFLNGTGGFACRVVSTRMLAPLIKEIILEIPPNSRGHSGPEASFN